MYISMCILMCEYESILSISFLKALAMPILKITI